MSKWTVSEMGRSCSTSTSGFLQPTEERGNIGRRLCSLSKVVARQWNYDDEGLSRLVQEPRRDVFHRSLCKTSRFLLPPAHRYVQRWHKRSGSAITVSLQRPSIEHILHRLQPTQQRPASYRQRQYRWWPGHHLPSLSRERRKEDTGWGAVSRDRWLRCQRFICVGAAAGHAYWIVYASSRGKAVLSTSATVQPDCRHQTNGREKRIGKLLVDRWCAKMRTAYQIHGCFWHGFPKCYTNREETNTVNGQAVGKDENTHLIPSTSSQSDPDVGIRA